MANHYTWLDVLGALVVAAPAIIAAISSIKNGREQKRVRKELEAVNNVVKVGLPKRPKRRKGSDDGNTASDPDWYVPPKF
jgi:hypothetical protein